MKKIVFALVVALGISQLIFAQAYEGNIEFGKKKQDAFMIDYSYPPKAAENAIISKMEQLGYKPKEEKGLFNKDKGFLIFKSAFINEISDASHDYLFKIEQRGRKSKDECVIYMVMQKDGNNIKAGMTADDIARAKTFLNNLKPNVEAANLELQIKDQEETVAKAEKKLRSLKDDEADLEKKLTKNKKDQEETEKDIENQRKMLETLKDKRVRN